jgi:hypothetical protein
MRITKAILKKLGFTLSGFYATSANQFAQQWIHTMYPFNHLTIFQDGSKFFLSTNGTHYDCSTLHKLLSSIYFCGINDGHEQKQAEIKKVLGIKEKR